MARNPNQPWQIYMVQAEGGVPERLPQENRNLGDPSFSADGNYLAFGVVPELMGKIDTSSFLQVTELATHRATTIPHSEGLYSPKWSPDGRYIAALTLEQKKLMLYDTKTTTWKMLAATEADHPIWAKDSKALYIRAYLADQKPVCRVSVPDGQVAKIADLSNFHAGTMTLANFSGLSLEDAPLMHAEISSGNLYSLNLDQPR